VARVHVGTMHNFGKEIRNSHIMDRYTLTLNAKLSKASMSVSEQNYTLLYIIIYSVTFPPIILLLFDVIAHPQLTGLGKCHLCLPSSTISVCKECCKSRFKCVKVSGS